MPEGAMNSGGESSEGLDENDPHRALDINLDERVLCWITSYKCSLLNFNHNYYIIIIIIKNKNFL